MTPLKAARLKSRMTQEELAEAAGVCRLTVLYAENNPARAPSLRTQRELCSTLKLDPEEVWPTAA